MNCQNWADFEVLFEILSSLPNKPTLPISISTLPFLSYKEIEFAHIIFTHERLEKVLRSLIKIKGLNSLSLSLLCHQMRSNELSQLFCDYLPLFANLKQFEVFFYQQEEFSLKNFEEIGLGLKSLHNLENLTLIFSGKCLVFTPESLYMVFADLPKTLDNLCIKFISKDQISAETLLTLSEIINSKYLKGFELYVEREVIEIYEYKADFLKSLKCSWDCKEETDFAKDYLSFFQSIAKKFQESEKFQFQCKFPRRNLRSVVFLKELKDSISLLGSLTFLRIQVNSRKLILCILEAIYREKNFKNLLSLELVESPYEYFPNELAFGDSELRLLLPLADQLVNLKILQIRFGKLDEKISIKFKYLTTFCIDVYNFFLNFKKFIKEKRRRLVFIAWIMNNKIRKAGGIFKRKQVMEEILTLFL